MTITALCKQLHCLPGPGGLFQQDPYLIDGISLVLDALNERQEKEQQRGARRTRT
jgi:hypothetical protein